jgi:hypothetical protein
VLSIIESIPAIAEPLLDLPSMGCPPPIGTGMEVELVPIAEGGLESVKVAL